MVKEKMQAGLEGARKSAQKYGREVLLSTALATGLGSTAIAQEGSAQSQLISDQTISANLNISGDAYAEVAAAISSVESSASLTHLYVGSVGEGLSIGPVSADNHTYHQTMDIGTYAERLQALSNSGVISYDLIRSQLDAMSYDLSDFRSRMGENRLLIGEGENAMDRVANLLDNDPESDTYMPTYKLFAAFRYVTGYYPLVSNDGQRVLGFVRSVCPDGVGTGDFAGNVRRDQNTAQNADQNVLNAVRLMDYSNTCTRIIAGILDTQLRIEMQEYADAAAAKAIAEFAAGAELNLNVKSYRVGNRVDHYINDEFWHSTYDGLNGADGMDGRDGVDGQDGRDGVAGPQGLQGSVGPQGPEGPEGPIGLTGPAGADGQPGPQGSTGPMGPAGPQGLQGSVGPQGPVGPEGPIGLTGADGLNGKDGAPGSSIDNPEEFFNSFDESSDKIGEAYYVDYECSPTKLTLFFADADGGRYSYDFTIPQGRLVHEIINPILEDYDGNKMNLFDKDGLVKRIVLVRVNGSDIPQAHLKNQ